MTIRKTLSALLASLMLLSLLPLALAEGPAPLTLGDGAPIPFLEGFTSRLIRDPALMAGITGQVDLRFRQDDFRSKGPIDIQLQNIALTDDVLAIFFQVDFKDKLPLEYGTAQESYDWIVPHVMPQVDGERRLLNIFSEGRPISDKAMLCLTLYSLKKPIPDKAVLRFNVDLDDQSGDKSQVRELKVDKSKMQDATRAVSPELPVALQFKRSEGRAQVNYQFKVDRVSFGPFGNRLLITVRDDGRDPGGFPCLLFDDKGQMLQEIPKGYQSSSLASPAKPVDVPNEIWFLGGEDTQSISLVPVEIIDVGGDEPVRPSFPIEGPFPASSKAHHGNTVTVNRFLLDESGFTVYYTMDGPGYVSFTLGDSLGKAFDFPFITFSGYDLPSQSLVMSGLWDAEYKGKPVARVSAEQLKEVKTLLFAGGYKEVDKPLHDLAVQVPLK